MLGLSQLNRDGAEDARAALSRDTGPLGVCRLGLNHYSFWQNDQNEEQITSIITEVKKTKLYMFLEKNSNFKWLKNFGD